MKINCNFSSYKFNNDSETLLALRLIKQSHAIAEFAK